MRTQFIVDPSLDITGYENIRGFFRHLSNGSFVPPEDILEAEQWVAEVHAKDAELLGLRTSEIADAWHFREQDFFQLASVYFEPTDFPTEEYTCYPTIWPLIARDPIAHTVAFPYQKTDEEACYVIAHELLHEIFFRHFHRKFASGNRFDMTDVRLWDLSEVLNVLVMRSSDWQSIFSFPAKPYPEHEELFNRLRPMWEEKANVDNLIHRGLGI